MAQKRREDTGRRTRQTGPRAVPILDAAPLPVLEVEGRAHQVSYASAAFCRLVGKSRGELVGKPFAEIVEGGEECIPILDEAYKKQEEAGADAPVDGDPDAAESQAGFCLQATWPAPDSNDPPVKVLVQMTRLAGFRQKAAAINESLLIAGLRQHELTEAAEKLNAQLRAEIAERKRAEAAKSLLASIVESSNDSIISVTFEGIVTSWNKAAERIHGYSAKEMIGKSLKTVTLPAELEQVLTAIERVKHNQKEELFETSRIHKDGSTIWLAVQLSPIHDARGHIYGVSTIARDITKLKNGQEALHASEAQLTETVGELEAFSYSLAHDLRAPLRGMQGFSQILLDQYFPQLDEEGQDLLRRISNSAQRLDALILDVLSYSKLIRAPVPLTRIDLDQLVRDIIATYPECQPAQADVHVADPLPPVLGNEAFLTQCVTNLLGNAVKFVQPGKRPRVIVWAERKGDDVRIWVEDNGIGINSKDQERIFRMFERVHAQGEYEGTGIGLAIVRKSIERLGGQFGLSSAPDHGSRFWIQLKKG